MAATRSSGIELPKASTRRGRSGNGARGMNTFVSIGWRRRTTGGTTAIASTRCRTCSFMTTTVLTIPGSCGGSCRSCSEECDTKTWGVDG